MSKKLKNEGTPHFPHTFREYILAKITYFWLNNDILLIKNCPEKSCHGTHIFSPTIMTVDTKTAIPKTL